MGCEDAYEGCGVRRCTQWAGVGAVLVGLAAAVSAAVVAGGTQVANIPSAVASTTDATPWMPRPNTLPRNIREILPGYVVGSFIARHGEVAAGIEPGIGLGGKGFGREPRHSECCAKCARRYRGGRCRRCQGGLSANERCKPTTERNAADSRSRR